MTQWLQQAYNQSFLSIHYCGWDLTAGKARELPRFTSVLTCEKPAEKWALGEGHPANKFEWTWVCCQAWTSDVEASTPTLPQVRGWLSRYLSSPHCLLVSNLTKACLATLHEFHAMNRTNKSIKWWWWLTHKWKKQKTKYSCVSLTDTFSLSEHQEHKETGLHGKWYNGAAIFESRSLPTAIKPLLSIYSWVWEFTLEYFYQTMDSTDQKFW